MMLDLNSRPAVRGVTTDTEDDDIRKYASSMRMFLVRRYKILILLMILGSVSGLAYLKLAQPSYTATAAIEVANREGRFLQQQATLADSPGDIDRDIALAKSGEIAETVAGDLGLIDDPEYDSPTSDLIARLRSIWSGASVDPSVSRTLTTISSIMNATRVSPDASDTSFTIAFSSKNPEKAARIANAIADAFITVRGQADAEIHKQASDWLVAQSDELAKRAKNAAAAVAEFVRVNNLILVDGKPLDQKNLEDINKRIAEAKEKLNEAKNRLDRIRRSSCWRVEGRCSRRTSSAEVSKEPTVAKDRERFADLTAQTQSLQRDFGKDSQKLRDLMSTAKANIVAELLRLRDNAQSDYSIANKNYNDLLAEQNTAVEAAHRAIYLNSQLTALQETEQNYRTLYEQFLQHSAEAVQELSFPIRAVRISERATAPLDKSWPKPFIVLAATTFAGLALGVCIGALRDFTDGVFRTYGQFESVTRLRCIGLIPIAATSRPRREVPLSRPSSWSGTGYFRAFRFGPKLKPRPTRVSSQS